MKRLCTAKENEIIWQNQSDILTSTIKNVRSKNKKVLPKGKYWINGATVVRCIGEHKEMGQLLMYAEDDLKDVDGELCSLEYYTHQSIDLKYGDRIMIVYCENGAYFPMLINERTRDFVPHCPPEYFHQISWHNVRKLVHPMEHILENVSISMNEEDMKDIIKGGRKMVTVQTPAKSPIS